MVDQETGSQWSQLLGKAMKGPLKGEKLQVFPSTLTDWKTWRSKHPRTTVATLERTSGTYNRSLHQRDEYLLIGLADEHEARFWYFSALRKHHVINDSFAGRPIVVCYDPPSGTAVIMSREVNGKTLTCELQAGRLVDQETGTRWDCVTGQAVDGELQGQRLVMLPAVVSLDRAWSDFYPDSKPGKHGLP